MIACKFTKIESITKHRIHSYLLLYLEKSIDHVKLLANEGAGSMPNQI